MITLNKEKIINHILFSQIIGFDSEKRKDIRVLDVIDQLGYIQIDTLSVVNRAHHHTLWSRLPDYQNNMLWDLLSKDRTVFEYWGHAASYLPMKDYRFYLPRMRSYKDPMSKWVKDRMEKYSYIFPSVLDRIKNEGPLSSKDFKNPKDDKRGQWWDWKPAKTALELLFWQGKLMISERRNFQRVYDITERVLPDWVDQTLPTNEEIAEFLIKRCLRAYFIAQEKEIHEFLNISDRKTLSKKLSEMLEDKQLQLVKLEGVDKPYYILSEKINEIETTKISNSDMYILSPFDNLLILRKRMLNLFDFNYALECYLPQQKRKYGYFSLPILWKSRFIGRADMKAERKDKLLLIKNLHFEDSFSDFSDSFYAAFNKSLKSFAEFNNCDKVKIVKVNKKIMSCEL